MLTTGNTFQTHNLNILNLNSFTMHSHQHTIADNEEFQS